MNTIKFVDVGEGITEGHVRKWLVADGATVKEDQPIVKVETDKAIVDVPAPISGIVKINANENTDVHIGDVIAYIGTEEELKAIKTGMVTGGEKPKPQPAQQSPVIQVKAPIQVQTGVVAAPSVRLLARELNVDMNSIKGTGPGGRVLEDDVKRVATGKSQAPVPVGETERIAMSALRKALARNVEESWKIPRATHMDMMNADALYNTVMSGKAVVEQRYGTKLTFLPFIIKATVEALKENPRFNSSYDGATSEIILKKYYNMGIAAESKDGLRVLVIKNADKKGIIDIAKEIQQLRQKMLDGSITLDDMKDSTFTITSIGSTGGGYLSVPVINPPNVAILGVHLIRDTPVVENNEIKIGKVLPFSLSFDHRVVDGADAVIFVNAIMKRLSDTEFLKINV